MTLALDTVAGRRGWIISDGKSGGTNWNRIGGVSDWDGTNNVLNGKLVTTAENGAFREYGGDELSSAVQATGQIFFRFTLTFGNGLPNYALLSSFESGTEKISFGRFTIIVMAWRSQA